mgnify:CR=1 FL=1
MDFVVGGKDGGEVKTTSAEGADGVGTESDWNRGGTVESEEASAACCCASEVGPSETAGSSETDPTEPKGTNVFLIDLGVLPSGSPVTKSEIGRASCRERVS